MHLFEIIPEHIMHQQAGISRYGYAACEALAALGVEIDVVTAACAIAGGQQPECGYRIHSTRLGLPDPSGPNALYDLNTLFITEAWRTADVFGRPDILHVHGGFSALCAACLKEAWNVPVAVTCHYSELGLAAAVNDPERASSYQAKVEQWLFDLADLIICPSQSVFQELRKANFVPSRKLTVVYNGVHIPPGQIDREVSHVRSLFGDGEEQVVLYAGRLSPEKGPQILLEAFRRVMRASDRVRLVFVGMGALESHLAETTARIGANGRVRFAGHLDTPELFQMFALCDVLVVPSLYESFGLVAAEAMSLGTPIVASDVGGLSELLRDGETALLVPPGDPVSLAKAVMRILEQDELRKTLGANARRKVETCFSWDVQAPQLADALASLLTPENAERVEAPNGALCGQKEAV